MPSRHERADRPGKAPGRPGSDEIRSWLVTRIAVRLEIAPEQVDTQETFASFGIPSKDAVALSGLLEEWLGRPVAATAIWEHPTIELLAAHLAAGEGPGTDVHREHETHREPLAIVGIGCRFPGASGPAAFWQLLTEGRDAITEVPSERWSIDGLFDADPAIPETVVTRWGGFLTGVDRFDAAFFGIAPREASRMDPQQRLLLEVTWEALEDAGLPAERLAGSKTGVFVGISTNDYGRLQFSHPSLIDAYAGTGNALSIAANRISYQFDFTGPSVALDTACSSSLVAVHMACRSLWSGESMLALAGGVNLMLSPDITINFTKAGVMAPDGRCKAFDARANGYVRGEGAAMVVLKPLSRARADGDPIYAVILGSAVNNDGRTNGLMAPSRQAQEAVVRDAYASANVSPGAVQYVEAHGTGTLLGDPIEAKALGTVLAADRAPASRCAIGSVKTNIGHLEAAAGIAGLVKVALALRHEAIPASLHFETPNPHIPFADLPLQVQCAPAEWPAGGNRVAGVSSFGFGGTNAHVVLAEAPTGPAPAAAEDDSSCRIHVLPLSARSPEALQALARASSAFLADASANGSLRDICHTAAVRRGHHPYRLAVTGRSHREMGERLAPYAEHDALDDLRPVRAAAGAGRQIVFVFPGQGAQWVGMGRQLLRQEPVFRTAIEECDRALRAFVDWSLLEELDAPDQRSRLSDIAVVQPVLFALQVALAALWRSWGVEPTAVVGHSMGEIAAAHVAGALTLPDAARIVCERSRLLGTVSGKGGMAVVELPIEAASRAAAAFSERMSIAVESSPTSTVLSGDVLALQTLIGALERQEVFCRFVNVDVASHSPQMDPLLAALRERLAGVRPRLVDTPLYSTVTGRISNGVELDAEYWLRNLREPVLFSTVVQQLLAGGCDAFLEISPHPTLLGAIQQGAASCDCKATILHTLRRDEDERATMLDSLCALYRRGHVVAWSRLTPQGRPVAFPSYPWQRERCWFEIDNAPPARALAIHPGNAGRIDHPLLGRHLASADDVKTHFWEVEVSTQSHPFVADHCIGNDPVLPATAYVEMALAAATRIFGPGCTLADVELTQALFLHKASCMLQLAVSERRGSDASFRICSRPGDNDAHEWTRHATGTIRRRRETDEAPPPAIDVAARRAASVEEIGRERYYEDLRSSGLNYGPSHQGLERIWRGAGEAIGRIRVPATLGTDAGYRLHPAVLDAALHVVGAAVQTMAHDGHGLFMPVRIGEVRVFDSPGAQFWSVVSSRGGRDASDRLRADVRLVDDAGTVVAEVLALELQRVRDDAPGRIPEADNWFYERLWEPMARGPGAAAPGVATELGRWIVFADRRGVARALAARIEARGGACAIVHPGVSYDASGEDEYEIDPGNPADARRLLDDVLADGCHCRGIAHFWSLDAAETARLDLAGLDSARVLGCVSVLHVVQALASLHSTGCPRLFLVTQHAQPVGEDEPVSVAQAPVWGLARTIALEHPETRATTIDLGEAAPAELDALFEELAGDGDDDQVALRGPLRYVARLVDVPAPEMPPATAYPFRLEVPSPGVIDRMVARPLSRRPPGTGEIEIEVAAAGLNFMDVMQTLGLVPAPSGSPIASGGECAGRVVAVGEGVEGMAPGDEVVAVAPGSFASFSTTSAALVARKPSHLSIAEAATIPVAFLTAYYALCHVARLRRGERVLVHAAAGGVGLAAVQIARARGAQVFATAGSPEKRLYLQSIGVGEVFDSRSSSFADGIMARTRGEGVDVVLNSLSGELADKSLGLLRRGGRFLEIGKRDIHENRPLPLRHFENGLAYFAIDLQRLCAERPAFVGAMLRRLLRRFEERALQPLPFQLFEMREVAAALRFMAQAKHTGKIVLTMPAAAPASHTNPSGLRGDATYLVTGGLGGIGLAAAQWMVAHGVRHLVLVGRRGASASADDALKAMRHAGATVCTMPADVGDRGQVAALLGSIAATMPPLRGIVHAAGVLDDGVLVQMDPARLTSVARPKTEGAWNLHTLTLDRALDFFVLFSSAASVFGSPGQGNYAAANAFLDALAGHRRANGLPALSVNWGPWGGVGLAAGGGGAARLAMRGVETIPSADGVDAFGRLLTSRERAQVLVVPIDWSRLDERAAMLPLLRRMTHDRPRKGTAPAAHLGDTAVRDAVLSAAPGERRPLLQSYICEQLARVMWIAPSAIDVRRPLNTLGVDSLMAIEFRNRIERGLGVRLPIAVLLQGPDVLQLADRLAEQLAGQTPDASSGMWPENTLPAIVPDPSSRHQVFPLNDIQGAYWVGRSASLELGNVGSHFYLEFERADLDVEHLSSAWQHLVTRHEMLRAVVRPDGQQQILADVPAYAIVVTDLEAATAQEAERQVEAIREELAHRVYDPTQWPLFTVRATMLPGGRVRVHVSVDLLIADVWSLFILFREWGTLYAAPAARLPPLTLSFRDYVLAEAALRTSSRYTRARDYWTARLPALRPGPGLPLARSPASIATPRFVRRSGRLDANRWQAIKMHARAHGLTPSMVLCAAFAEVLAAWSKDGEFTLNVTLFQRQPLHDDVGAIVGDFTSTVLLAVDGDGAASLVGRARRLQHQLSTDLDHREFSGVRVLRDLARQAASGPRVAMPVVFTSTLGQESGSALAHTAWLGELVHGISQTPQVWLDHQVGEDGPALIYNWDAIDALFPPGLLDSMFAAYTGRLTQLATGGAAWAVPTSGLIPETDVRLQHAMNATETPVPDTTLHALVAAQVAQRPSAPAVVTSTRELTYGELGARAEAVARWVCAHGAEPNRLVAIVMEKGWEQVVAVVGVAQSGAAYLPIEADVPDERLARLLAQGEATLVLTQSWLVDTLEWPPGLTVQAVDRLDQTAVPGSEGPGAAPQSDDLAYVIFTSGSTGVPKGVMLTHRAVVNTLLDLNARWSVGPSDRVLALSALSFDLSVYDIFGTLAAGGAIVLPGADGRRDPAHWLARLAEARVTVWNSVPALMQLLVEAAEAGRTPLPDSLRLVLLSGDWIPVRLPDRIRAAAPAVRVVSLGGATEAAIWSIYYPIGDVDPAWASIPYGRPLANQIWQVLHADGTPCPVWVPGELYIGGAGLAQGYWRDPERTRERFVTHPTTGARLYRTGDWGRYWPDGNIEFLGRDDLQVKVQGYRIELGEIEAALLQQPGIAQAVVTAQGERMGDKRLVAGVVGNGAVPPDAAELRAALQATLPHHLVPSIIHVLPALPLTSNGKVDRGALAALQPHARGADLSSTSRVEGAPGSMRTPGLAAADEDVGGRIERLVTAVLRVDHIDRHADLFALGLTSIDMMRLGNDLEQTFGFRPRMADLFSLANLAGLISYYECQLAGRQRDVRTTAERPQDQQGLRASFAKDRRALRAMAGPLPPLRLLRTQSGPGGARSAAHDRRSQRRFSAEPVALADLAGLLQCLAEETSDGRARYRYGSAGGLYPVQVYLHVRPRRVDGCADGTYYYHPVEHGLQPLSPGVDLDPAVHALVNRPMFDRAAFSIFLVAQMSAITPVYAEKAPDFALIEAGLITQLLETSAAIHHIGLCQIGLIDFDAIRNLFLLEESHLFLHALVGGRIDAHVAWEEGTL
jgi:amino acid adenylation domain-containing protein